MDAYAEKTMPILTEHDRRHHRLYISACYACRTYEKANQREAMMSLEQLYCARYGISDTIVSDNDPLYPCHAFARFFESWGITHVTSSHYNSNANGKAESAVKTCKQIMRKCIDSGCDPFLDSIDHRVALRHRDCYPVRRST